MDDQSSLSQEGHPHTGKENLVGGFLLVCGRGWPEETAAGEQILSCHKATWAEVTFTPDFKLEPKREKASFQVRTSL